MMDIIDDLSKVLDVLESIQATNELTRAGQERHGEHFSLAYCNLQTKLLSGAEDSLRKVIDRLESEYLNEGTSED